VRYLISFLAAAATGILSGWGVGGGTLLVIFMTTFQNVAQHSAQGINLLYFIPSSAAALYSHIKNGMIEKAAAVPAAVCGSLAAAAAAFFAASVDTFVLKKIFSIFLLVIGTSELFRKRS